MTTEIAIPDGLDALRATFNGQVIRPSDPGYDERRAHFNTRYDMHPAVIAVPSGTADVVAAVKFARGADLEIAVSSGGKHPAGFSRTEGGIVVDLSGMRAVKVDPDEQTAWVQGGANGGDLMGDALVHGLGGVAGWMRSTGIGGVCLNAGVGALTGRLGYGVDTILELELVTAEGEVLRVSPDENPDLFWALRGTAPNFGIVTWMKMRLCPVPAQVTAGFLVWDAEQAPKVLGMLERFMLESPEELSFLTAYAVTPAEPDYPEEMHGKLTLQMMLVHSGDLADAEEDLRPLRETGPALDWVYPQGLFEFMCTMDEYVLPGRWSFQSVEVGAISEKLIDVVGRGASAMVELGLLKGEVFVGPWGNIRNNLEFPNPLPCGLPNTGMVGVAVSWEDPADDEKAEGWAKAVIADLQHEGLTLDGVQLNLHSTADVERDRRAYGEENWKRLTELKAKYDPENVFHLNHNIPPAN